MGRLCTNSWYSQKSSYDFNNPTFSASTGLFTQLVWASSTQVGFGLASSFDPRMSMNGLYCIAQYQPAGD